MKRVILILLTVLIFCMTFSVVVFAQSDTEFKTGDVDKNTSINVKDATLIQKYVASLAQLDDGALALADTDANGNVNVKDATLIQKFVAGLVAQFPQNGNTADKPTQAFTSVPETTQAIISTSSAAESTQALPTDTTPTAVPSTVPSQAPTKPSVDSDGYFDVIIRP